MRKGGFTGGVISPYLYMKQSIKGKEYIALNVDDNLIIDNPEIIVLVVKWLQEHGLVFKVIEELYVFFQKNKVLK